MRPPRTGHLPIDSQGLPLSQIDVEQADVIHRHILGLGEDAIVPPSINHYDVMIVPIFEGSLSMRYSRTGSFTLKVIYSLNLSGKWGLWGILISMWVQQFLILRVIRLQNPNVIQDMTVLIAASKDIEPLNKWFLFENFLPWIFFFIQPKMLLSVPRLIIPIILMVIIVYNCSCRVHLSISQILVLNFIIWSMLLINSTVILVYFEWYPFLQIYIEESKVIEDFLLLCVKTSMNNHNWTQYTSHMVLSLLWSSFDIWLLKPLLLLSIKYLNIIEAQPHLNGIYIRACSSKYIKFATILAHSVSKPSMTNLPWGSDKPPSLSLNIKDSYVFE